MVYDYYQQNLSAERLRKAYEIAPPRVQQYLKAEIDFVLSRIKPSDRVLELGCGYGRVLPELANRAKVVAGIDNALPSLKLARGITASNIQLAAMNAADTAFADQAFDLVVCLQNGISAFHVDPVQMVRENLRLTKIGGRVLISSYSDKFWGDRLEWFELQAGKGLLGLIDYDATGDGIIACKDGFRATTYTVKDFELLLKGFAVEYSMHEVDQSSLFCEIIA